MSHVEPTFEDKAFNKIIGKTMNEYSTSMKIHVIYDNIHNY